jgi:cytosine/adenosine deaminase-related metal-dependent hydrolase
MMSEGKGLTQFIKEIIPKRKALPEVVTEAIEKAEEEMIANGIVAVGDICNTTDTIERKKNNRLKYYNFIEVFDLNASHADEEFEKGKLLYEKFRNLNQPCSIIPHAPYTVSQKLLKRIYDFAYVNEGVLSVHNEETESENLMFRERKGELFETLSSFGNLYDDWKATGFNSLPSAVVHLPKCNPILLVHNTFTSSEDINWVHLYTLLAWWCFCPNANLFIEKRLPDFQLFIDGGCKVVIGTDSYASNWSLSILDELKTISKQAPKVKLDTLLKWATLNGAELFGFSKELGSIEKGKKPGLNLITGIRTEPLELTEFSKVQKLV